MCDHNKIYSSITLLSHPPKIPWTCSKCGERGFDRTLNRKNLNLEYGNVP